MAKSEWVDGGRYYVGSNGLWETKSSTNSEYSAALEKAKSYNSWANMSKKRLYKQLTSKYGEKFLDEKNDDEIKRNEGKSFYTGRNVGGVAYH